MELPLLSQVILSKEVLDSDGMAVLFDRQSVKLILLSSSLQIRGANGNAIKSINLDDVVGSVCKKDIDGIVLEIFAYEDDNSFFASFCRRDKMKSRQRRVYRFYFSHTSELDCQNFKNTINGLIQSPGTNESLPVTRAKRYLLIVNPVSGQRKGIQMWETNIKPIYLEANILVNLLVTVSLINRLLIILLVLRC